MECRLKFLKVLNENMSKIEGIALKVEQMYLVKQSYDIAEEGTSTIVLILLLAEK